MVIMILMMDVINVYILVVQIVNYVIMDVVQFVIQVTYFRNIQILVYHIVGMEF